LPGITPSATVKVQARMWSAMTFSDGSRRHRRAAGGELHRVLGRRQQAHEQVDLVVAVHMLQHRGQALQAHAGVHAGLGQRCITPSSVRLNCMKTLFQISM
jgi:hypothetical protein